MTASDGVIVPEPTVDLDATRLIDSKLLPSTRPDPEIVTCPGFTAIPVP